MRMWNVECGMWNAKIRNPQSPRGITLLELLVASVLGLVVLLAIGQVDVTRVLLGQKVRTTTQFQSEAGLAVAHMTRQLVQADRINLISSDNAQFRYVVCPTEPPDPACYDDANNYRWAQYAYRDTDADGTPDAIRFYDDTNADCGVDLDFHDISNLTVAYRNETPEAPPGGEPPVDDNNVLEMTVEWTEPQSGTVYPYRGEIAIRAGAYTNVTTGLAPPGVSGPPASCS